MPPVPQYVRNVFAAVPPTTTDEHSYYGPMNKLLSHYFPEDRYIIAPQARPVPGTTRESIDFLVTDQNLQPLVFFEVKAESTLTSRTARADADVQMRLRFSQLFPNCPLRVLYGISFFGTKMCIYRSRGPHRISPPRIPQAVHTVRDISPVTRYALDITTINDSVELFNTLARVKNMVNNL